MGTDLQVMLWVLPLTAVISLVYSASRYELTGKIISRATKLCAQILGFMAVVMGVLWFFSTGI
jgi:uncharacterized membrane protein